MILNIPVLKFSAHKIYEEFMNVKELDREELLCLDSFISNLSSEDLEKDQALMETVKSFQVEYNKDYNSFGFEFLNSYSKELIIHINSLGEIFLSNIDDTDISVEDYRELFKIIRIYNASM